MRSMVVGLFLTFVRISQRMTWSDSFGGNYDNENESAVEARGETRG